VSLMSKVLMVLYRLAVPGGLLLAIAVLLIRAGALAQLNSPGFRFVPLAVFLIGLVLGGVFRRSRLFFAMLTLALAQTAMAWIVPSLSPQPANALANAVALLLPLNVLALAFLRERGIVSPAGRRRLAGISLEVMAAAALCLPQLAPVTALLRRSFVPEVLSRWSHLSQPELLAFLVATAVMAASLIKRYRSVESSLLWALVACFVALRMGGANTLAGLFFATGGLMLIVALLETSYKMAYHDELTQLPSRRALNEALLKLPETFSIAMIDVDHFKKFNDSYGHEAGDQALRLVASRLARVAGGGRAYRYGGEEFAVLFPGKPSDEVFVYLDRMRKLIEQSTFIVRGKDRRKNRAGKARMVDVKKETNVTVSVGLASTNGERMAPADVLRIADRALYRAKAKGRNCTVTARHGSKVAAGVQPSMHVVSAS
jgi:diguanylate cyclase (GGDEF)-like protein